MGGHERSGVRADWSDDDYCTYVMLISRLSRNGLGWNRKNAKRYRSVSFLGSSGGQQQIWAHQRIGDFANSTSLTRPKVALRISSCKGGSRQVLLLASKMIGAKPKSRRQRYAKAKEAQSVLMFRCFLAVRWLLAGMGRWIKSPDFEALVEADLKADRALEALLVAALKADLALEALLVAALKADLALEALMLLHTSDYVPAVRVTTVPLRLSKLLEFLLLMLVGIETVTEESTDATGVDIAATLSEESRAAAVIRTTAVDTGATGDAGTGETDRGEGLFYCSEARAEESLSLAESLIGMEETRGRDWLLKLCPSDLYTDQ
ncbi:hypothetical protein ZIOFF_074436 (mitochondrion) [Zingiber officinale]|uniref:Uncharacterized protein n=1 Tax=Zingiber officinale TaxID=94328 RepID=A0A8J5ES42_ZINOF|nr:hypothetical protein ZIOFF_074436 [Zingiber officinale]